MKAIFLTNKYSPLLDFTFIVLGASDSVITTDPVDIGTVDMVAREPRVRLRYFSCLTFSRLWAFAPVLRHIVSNFDLCVPLIFLR